MEFRQTMRALGLVGSNAKAGGGGGSFKARTTKDADDLFARLDTDGNGELDMKEITSGLKDMLKSSASGASLPPRLGAIVTGLFSNAGVEDGMQEGIDTHKAAEELFCESPAEFGFRSCSLIWASCAGSSARSFLARGPKSQVTHPSSLISHLSHIRVTFAVPVDDDGSVTSP